MAQPARTLTAKLSDGTTQTLAVPAGAQITPQQLLAHIKTEGGFWSTQSTTGDKSGNTVGAVFVNWESIVTVTIS